MCAGFETTAMIDTGASISVIDKSFLEKINLTYCVDSNRQILCKLADGTTITLDKKIVLPIKFNNITIEADLFILPMNHVEIIIGCDLLHLLNARIDFSSNTLMLQKPLPITKIKIACLQHNSLGHLKVTRQDTHTTPKSHVSELEDRVKRIDIHKSNITSTQKSDIVHLLNNYTDIFAILDLKSAFQQVPLSKISQKICTFSSPMGCVRLKTCPFGLKNLPSVFTKLMDIIFIDIKNTYMTYYLDDVIIFSETFNDHLQHLNEVFSRLKKAKLTLQPEKTHLFMKSVVFLGVKISSDGIKTEDRNITKVKNFLLKTQNDQLKAS